MRAARGRQRPRATARRGKAALPPPGERRTRAKQPLAACKVTPRAGPPTWRWFACSLPGRTRSPFAPPGKARAPRAAQTLPPASGLPTRSPAGWAPAQRAATLPSSASSSASSSLPAPLPPTRLKVERRRLVCASPFQVCAKRLRTQISLAAQSCRCLLSSAGSGAEPCFTWPMALSFSPSPPKPRADKWTRLAPISAASGRWPAVGEPAELSGERGK